MISLLSIDLPWGAQNVVGGAFALVDSAGIEVIAHSVSMPKDPPTGPRVPEIDEFIRYGAALGTALNEDASGPFCPGMPVDASSRALYVDRVVASLRTLAAALPGALECAAVLIDVPFVPANLARANAPRVGRRANMRPVERAFQCKVRVPVGSARAVATNFARFQAGVIRGYRPGYALASAVQQVLGAQAVLESFPQLAVGALAEMAENLHAQPQLSLAAHKTRPFAGQTPLLDLISIFLGKAPRWATTGLPEKSKADGIDAILGLLTLLPLHGHVPPGDPNAAHKRTVKLLNLAGTPPLGMPQRPPRGTGPLPAYVQNSRHWIDSNPRIQGPIDDSGIFALDLGVWQ